MTLLAEAVIIGGAMMAASDKPQILLTNDDGIRSPGLWAAAEVLCGLGYITVAAPREQCSGAGRSMPNTSDGRLREEEVEVGGESWKVYAVGGTPAQAVQHGALELMPRPPDLVVAGINYGENLGLGVTVSGTVGAALEGGALGYPSLAVSLEMPESYYFSYSEEIDFSAAAHFTQHFGQLLLERRMPEDVHVLKIDVPSDATPETPWKMTRLSRHKYYTPVPPQRERLEDSKRMGFEVKLDEVLLEQDSDVYVVRLERHVAVTPLSLDMTSRVDLEELESLLREAG